MANLKDDILIIEPSENDLNLIANLDYELLNGTWTFESYKDENNNNPFNHLLIAKMSDEIVGFIDYMVTFDNCSICRIAVKKAYQNKGIGTLLINKMISYLAKYSEAKVNTIALEVSEKNENAIKFYLKNGFVKVAVKEHYYDDGSDAYYLLRRLD